MSKFELIKNLTELRGIPGHEKDVADFVREKIKDHVKTVSSDNLGSVIGVKGHKGPKVIIGGHLDEVGLMVTNITNDGYIKFIPIGGWFSQVMLAQKWDITTKRGIVRGITGVKPPHLIPLAERSKAIPIEQMYIDIGVSSKEEAIDLGVEPGQMITPFSSFEVIGNGKYLLAKAFDNRIGSAVVIELLKELEEKDLESELFGVFTVQEEVGLRGAKTTSHIIEPEIVFAIDTGLGLDVPGGDKDEQTLGKGPQILLYDGGLIGHRKLRRFVIDVAKELEIPYQEAFIQGGRTDAGNMHLAHSGAAALSICLPTRNMHSHTSVIHYDDYLNTIKLLKEVIKRLNKDSVNDILYGE